MLRPEDTPEHKDNLINQLTDEKNKLKDKVDKLKEKADKFDEADNDGTLMLGCLRNFRFEKESYNGGTSINFSLCNSDLNVKDVSLIQFYRNSVFAGTIRFNSPKQKSSYKYINDLINCSLKFDSVVCYFHGNNDKKIKNIFLLKGTRNFQMPQYSIVTHPYKECVNPTNNLRWQYRIPGPGIDYQNYNYMFGFGQFPSSDLFSSAKNGTLELKNLLTGIENYLNSLNNDTMLGDKSFFTKNDYTYIGVIFKEHKNIKNKFLSNGHIESIGYYGVDKDLNKIMKPDYTIVPNGRGTPCAENANHAGFFGQEYGSRSRWGSRPRDRLGYTYKIEYIPNILLAEMNQSGNRQNTEYF